MFTVSVGFTSTIHEVDCIKDISKPNSLPPTECTTNPLVSIIPCVEVDIESATLCKQHSISFMNTLKCCESQVKIKFELLTNWKYVIFVFHIILKMET